MSRVYAVLTRLNRARIHKRLLALAISLTAGFTAMCQMPMRIGIVGPVANIGSFLGVKLAAFVVVGLISYSKTLRQAGCRI